MERVRILPADADASVCGEPEGGDGVAAVPSPFLDGTNIQWAWDATSLSAFKKCPRYYQLRHVEGWGPASDQPIHLRWGIEYHHALEEFDRQRAYGVSHDDAVSFVLRQTLDRIKTWEPDPRTKSEELKTKEHLVRSIIWYLEHFRNDPAKTFILGDGEPAVEMNFCFGLDRDYSLCGYLDRVVDWNGNLFVMDRKSTTSTPGSYYFERYDLDEQMTAYNLAAQVLLQAPIKGVIIDVVQVAVGFSRFTRGITYRTSEQLEEWIEQLHTWFSWAETCAVDNNWPMNLTSCDKYGGCEFRGVCSKSPSVREKFLRGQFERKERWNPLKPR